MPYKEDPNYTIYEYACHEGNYMMTDALTGARELEKEGVNTKVDNNNFVRKVDSSEEVARSGQAYVGRQALLLIALAGSACATDVGGHLENAQSGYPRNSAQQPKPTRH